MENSPAKIEDHVLHIFNQSTQKMDTIDLNTGIVTSGTESPVKYSGTSYSHSIGDLICEKVRTGTTISAIARDPQMPSLSAIYAWMSTNVEFKRRINDARKARAEHYHDLALDIALSTDNKDEVPVNRLKIDTLKWAAEKNDPERFNKPTAAPAVQGGINIVLDLGMGNTPIPTNYDIDEKGELKEIKNGTHMGNSNGERGSEHRGDIELTQDRWTVFEDGDSQGRGSDSTDATSGSRDQTEGEESLKEG